MPRAQTGQAIQAGVNPLYKANRYILFVLQPLGAASKGGVAVSMPAKEPCNAIGPVGTAVNHLEPEGLAAILGIGDNKAVFELLEYFFHRTSVYFHLDLPPYCHFLFGPAGCTSLCGEAKPGKGIECPLR
jgi:hypothetical protein